MQLQRTEKRPLPTLDELYENPLIVSKQNDLNRLLNCEPKKDWVREHPFAKNVKYIPISIIEYLLTSIFVKWRVEVKDTKVIANSVCVTVRLWVQDPVSMEWDWQEGIGAAPIQTSKGAEATDFSKVLTDAVMKSAPAAESYAVKDAAEKLGKIFGKDLNRVDWLPYTNLDGKLDFEVIQAGSDDLNNLRSLVFKASITHEEKDYLIDKIEEGMTLWECIKETRRLNDLVFNPLDKLKNGEGLKQSDIDKAVKKASSLPNT